MGENQKILQSHFLPTKFTIIGVVYTKRCGLATFGGVCFLRNVDFFQYFHEKIIILDF